MNQHRLPLQLTAIVVLFVVTVAQWADTGRVEITWFRLLTPTVLIASILLLVWDRWLWRTRWSQRSPKVPIDISGTWQGVLTSMWKDPQTGLTPPPKTVFLVVQQTGTAIVSLRLLTNESSSMSTSAAARRYDGHGEIDYVYTNEPSLTVTHRSRPHRGGAFLRVAGVPAQRIEGSYWTDRDSKGTMVFDARAKHRAGDFKAAERLFT